MEYPVPDPLDVEQLFSESRSPDIVVHKLADGTIVADGEDKQIDSGTSVSTIMESAISTAEEGDLIVVKGNYTVDSPIEVNKRLHIIQRGKLTLNSNFIELGTTSTVLNATVNLDDIDGQDYTNGYIPLVCKRGKRCIFRFNRVENCGKIIYLHAVDSDVSVSDNEIHLPKMASELDVAVDIYAENNDCEGNVFFGGMIWNTTGTFHFHGTAGAGAGMSTIVGTGLHGTQADRNDYEIQEEGAGGSNFWMPKFLSNGTVNLFDTSMILHKNSIQRGDQSGNKPYIRLEDSGGNIRNVLHEVGADGLRLEALNGAPGAEAGVLQLRGDDRVEVVDSTGASLFKVTPTDIIVSNPISSMADINDSFTINSGGTNKALNLKSTDVTSVLTLEDPDTTGNTGIVVVGDENQSYAGGNHIHSFHPDGASALRSRDSAPSSPVNNAIYLASPAWDPDGDGNGEYVVTDDGGTTWHELLDLPNYT